MEYMAYRELHRQRRSWESEWWKAFNINTFFCVLLHSIACDEAKQGMSMETENDIALK